MKKSASKKYLCPRCKKRFLMKNGFKPALVRADGTKVPRRQQWMCRIRNLTANKNGHCYTTMDPTAPYRDQNSIPKGKIKVRKPFRRKIDTSRMMVFTAAQNATPIHEGFFETLKVFADANGAELCVIPLRYKNPTSIFASSQRNEEHWLRDVAENELRDAGITEYNYERKGTKLFSNFGIAGAGILSWLTVCDKYATRYLYEQRRKLNSNLVAVGDVKIQPTAGDPLTGMNSFTHGESAIFGHTKLRMKCVATPQSRMAKQLTTTGACTMPNYTDSKAGKKGEFHHVLGAVVVEIVNDKKFHMHHINARKRDGAFIFMNEAYYPDGSIEFQDSCQAIIFGDVHHRFVDPEVVEATFGDDGLVEMLNPKIFVWHDLLDCYFGNPHHKDNPFIKKAKHSADFHIAEDEVRTAVAWMQKLGAGRKNYIIASNHDDMFARWVIREDWKEIDPANMEFYLETALQMARSAKMSDIGAEYDDPCAYWIKRLTDDPNIIALSQNEQFMVDDIYLSMHGDKGPNGARGTIKNLSEIGVKIVSGHGHSPAIQDGHTRVGTMSRLELEYTKGPGGWLNTHCTIDNFGKRHLHTCIDGRFWL